MKQPASLVVLPTYNERANIHGMVTSIRATGCHVLVVDDNSPDGTGQLADELAANDDGVEVLHRPGKLGLGSAYIAGFKVGLARAYDSILSMDADGSHAPSYLHALIDAAQRSGGVAIGSRYVDGGSIHGWGLQRLVLSRSANAYCRRMLRIPIHDCTSGFRCYQRAVLEDLGLDSIVSQGYSFLIETAYRCVLQRCRVVEVPIRFEDRVAGQSKVSHTEIRKALTLVLRLRIQSGRAPKPLKAAAADEVHP